MLLAGIILSSSFVTFFFLHISFGKFSYYIHRSSASRFLVKMSLVRILTKLSRSLQNEGKILGDYLIGKFYKLWEI